jgi:hypothetical protein
MRLSLGPGAWRGFRALFTKCHAILRICSCWALGKRIELSIYKVRLGKEHQVMCKFLCLHLTERKDRRRIRPFLRQNEIGHQYLCA